MRKLTLNPDELRVESFDTEPQQRARGTVRGADDSELEMGMGEDYAITTPRTNPDIDCPRITRLCSQVTCNTCNLTCPNTCANTCSCPPLCTLGCTEVYTDCRFTGDPVCCT